MYLIGGGIDETLSVGHARCLIDKYGLEAKSKAEKRQNVTRLLALHSYHAMLIITGR